MDQVLASYPPGYSSLLAEFEALKWDPEDLRVFLDTVERERVGGLGSVVREEGTVGEFQEVVKNMNEEKYAMEAMVSKEINGKPKKKPDGHFTMITVELTEAQQQFVRAELTGVTTPMFVRSREGNRREHPVACALRKVFDTVVYRMLPAGCRVLEVGANMHASVMRAPARGKYVGLTPAISVFDVARHRVGRRAIEIALKQKGRRELKPAQRYAAEHLDEFFVPVVVQEYDQPTDAIISNEVYDVSLEDSVLAMRRTGARIWLGRVTRVLDLCNVGQPSAGRVGPLGFNWEVDKSRDVIKFWFGGTSSKPYEHKYSDVFEYQAFQEKTFRCGGRTYVYKHDRMSTDNVLFYTIRDVGVVRPVDEPLPCVQRNPEGHLLELKGTDMQYTAQGVLVPSRSSIMVDEEIFNRILQDRLTDKRATVQSLVTNITSTSVNIVYNGVRVSTANPLAIDRVREFAERIDTLAKDMECAVAKDVTDVANTLATGGVERGALKRFKAAVDSFVFGKDSLVRVVRDRVKTMVGASVADAVTVKRQAKAILRHDKVRVIATQREVDHFVTRNCFCVERKEVDEMLTGLRGGLTCIETEALRKYKIQLSMLECRACEFDVDEFVSAEAEELSDVESGYVSAESTCVDVECDDDDDEDGKDAAAVLQSLASGTADDLDTLLQADETVDFPQQTGLARDGIREFAYILRTQMAAVDSVVMETARVIGRSGLSPFDYEAISRYDSVKCQWFFLKVVNGVLQKSPVVDVRTVRRIYDFDADDYHMVHVTRDVSSVPVTVSSVVLTCSQYLIWNNPALLSRCSSVLRDPTVGPLLVRFDFTNAIYGAGKTFTMKNKMKKMWSQGEKPVYVTKTTANAKSVRSAFPQMGRAARDLIRTYDSLVMHGLKARGVDKLFCDEVPMIHAGQLFVLLHMLRPAAVEMYGDFFQMPYVSFIAHFEAQYASLRSVCDVTMVAKTHRCSIPIVAASSIHYVGVELSVCGEGCHPATVSEQDLEFVRVKSIGDIPIADGMHILCAKQWEKDEIAQHIVSTGLKGCMVNALEMVNTAGEVQGEQFEWNVWVRLDVSQKPDSIYQEMDRLCMAMTRTVGGRFIAYSMSEEEDAMSKLCRAGNDIELRNVVKRNSGIDVV